MFQWTPMRKCKGNLQGEVKYLQNFCHWFLLFMVHICSNITTNMELVNSQLLLWRETQGSVPVSFWSQQFLWSINISPYFYMFWCIYCWFINVDLTAKGTITHAWTKFIWHTYFLCKLPHSLPYLGTLESTSTLFLGVIFNCKIIQKSKKMWKAWP